MFIICTNDYPFAVLDVETEEQADEVCRQFQRLLDKRQSMGSFMRKTYVHLHNIPVISGLQDIKVPRWNTKQPFTVIKSEGGDIVIAPTAKGDSVARISEVNVPESRISDIVMPLLKTITAYAEGQEVQ